MSFQDDMHVMQQMIQLHDNALERMSIEFVGHDDYDAVVKRLDQLETAVQNVAEKAGIQL